MFKITLENEAKLLLDSHFAENPKAEYIRLYVRPRKSSRGSTLALKPDVLGERDITVEENGYRFVLSKHLLGQVGQWATISANEKGGFRISSEKNFNN